jgi:hypothetical protein
MIGRPTRMAADDVHGRPSCALFLSRLSDGEDRRPDDKVSVRKHNKVQVLQLVVAAVVGCWPFRIMASLLFRNNQPCRKKRAGAPPSGRQQNVDDDNMGGMALGMASSVGVAVYVGPMHFVPYGGIVMNIF